MGAITKALIIVIFAWVFIYTVSYGVWTWKKDNNRLGAVAIFILIGFISVIYVYITFIRQV